MPSEYPSWHPGPQFVGSRRACRLASDNHPGAQSSVTSRGPAAPPSQHDIIFSGSYNWSLEPPVGSRIRVVRRGSDWGMTRFQKARQRGKDLARLLRESRHARAVVLSTLGIEAAVYSAVLRLARPRSRVVVFDFLMPTKPPAPKVGPLLFRSVDEFLIIRRGDAAALRRRYSIHPSRCTFVSFPLTTTGLPAPKDGDYVYAAGWAHRDWETLLRALVTAGQPAVIATGDRSLSSPSPDIKIIEMPSPEDGRLLASASMAVAVVMHDTELPAGPLVLLDAMAMGKPVVCSDVNGTRDYVHDRRTALVVPPGDDDALAAALVTLRDDPAIRDGLAREARTWVDAHCSAESFWASLGSLARDT